MNMHRKMFQFKRIKKNLQKLNLNKVSKSIINKNAIELNNFMFII